MRIPPASTASDVAGMVTRMVASPPIATKPMMPTLNNPASPHCRLTPSAMIALINPILRI
jgi:hypothetical protein